jgi:nucleoside-diphosphate-sugar epimerase
LIVPDTVLVTGGSGFIGSHLIEQLIERGDRVVNYDVRPHSGPLAWYMRNYLDRISFVEGDLQSWPELMAAVRKHRVNKIAHIAASIDVTKLYATPKLAFDIMVSGTVNVLEVARIFEIERVVFCSSIGVLATKQYEPIDCHHPTVRASEGTASASYGAGKLAGEAFCWAYRDAYNLDFVIVRPSAAYGFLTRNEIYLNELLEGALRGETVRLTHGGKHPRDYSHVDDIAGIIVAALDVSSDRLTHRCFYAASGCAPLVTAAEVASIVREIVPAADVYIDDYMNEYDLMDLRLRGVLDVKPVTEQLGYRHRYRDIRDGLIQHARIYSEYLRSLGKEPALGNY